MNAWIVITDGKYGGIIMNKNSSRAYINSLIKYYGEYIPVPVELLVNPKYNGAGERKRLRHNSAILYGVLLRLSKRKNEVDENGYITITNRQIAEIVGTTTSETVKKMIEELEAFDLVKRDTPKPGRPYKLYVKEIKA